MSKSRTLFLPVNITVFPFDFPQSSMKCTTSPYLNDGCPVNTTQGVLKQLLNPSAKITLYETGDVQRHSHPNIMTCLRATNGLCIDQFEALTRPLPPPPRSPTGGGENIRWSHKEPFNIGWGSWMQCNYHTNVIGLWWGRKNSKTFKD